MGSKQHVRRPATSTGIHRINEARGAGPYINPVLWDECERLSSLVRIMRNPWIVSGIGEQLNAKYCEIMGMDNGKPFNFYTDKLSAASNFVGLAGTYVTIATAAAKANICTAYELEGSILDVMYSLSRYNTLAESDQQLSQVGPVATWNTGLAYRGKKGMNPLHRVSGGNVQAVITPEGAWLDVAQWLTAIRHLMPELGMLFPEGAFEITSKYPGGDFGDADVLGSNPNLAQAYKLANTIERLMRVVNAIQRDYMETYTPMEPVIELVFENGEVLVSDSYPKLLNSEPTARLEERRRIGTETFAANMSQIVTLLHAPFVVSYMRDITDRAALNQNYFVILDDIMRWKIAHNEGHAIGSLNVGTWMVKKAFQSHSDTGEVTRLCDVVIWQLMKEERQQQDIYRLLHGAGRALYAELARPLPTGAY